MRCFCQTIYPYHIEGAYVFALDISSPHRHHIDVKLAEYFETHIVCTFTLHTGYVALQSQSHRIHFIYCVKAFRQIFHRSPVLYKLCWIWFNLNSKQGENLLLLRLCVRPTHIHTGPKFHASTHMLLQWSGGFLVDYENASNKKSSCRLRGLAGWIQYMNFLCNIHNE